MFPLVFSFSLGNQITMNSSLNSTKISNDARDYQQLILLATRRWCDEILTFLQICLYAGFYWSRIFKVVLALIALIWSDPPRNLTFIFQTCSHFVGNTSSLQKPSEEYKTFSTRQFFLNEKHSRSSRRDKCTFHNSTVEACIQSIRRIKLKLLEQNSKIFS